MIALLPGLAAAEQVPILDAPSGPIILTVTGRIAHKNAAEGAEFDHEMLTSLPVSVIRTHTPWTDGVTEFRGVPLADLLEVVGASPGVLHAVGLNDYSVDIPTGDASTAGPIVAYERDGRLMSVREKGPLWIMYPFDENPSLRNELYRARAIWQLRSLDVRE